jgi:hypothetical protein
MYNQEVIAKKVTPKSPKGDFWPRVKPYIRIINKIN